MKTIHDLQIDDYLAACVQVFPEQMQEEFVRIPADLAYWNAQYANALRGHLTAKLEREQTEARLQLQARNTLTEDGKKPTEKAIEAAVEAHSEYTQARVREIEAEVDKARAHGVVDAVRSKRDMLISLGAHVRAEMEHDPSIREMSRARKLHDK